MMDACISWLGMKSIAPFYTKNADSKTSIIKYENPNYVNTSFKGKKEEADI